VLCDSLCIVLGGPMSHHCVAEEEERQEFCGC
jgi:hypothetical protein